MTTLPTVTVETSDPKDLAVSTAIVSVALKPRQPIRFERPVRYQNKGKLMGQPTYKAKVRRQRGGLAKKRFQ